MGRHRKHRKSDQSFAQKRRDRENKWNDKAPRKSYEDIVKENVDFENYYKLQKICDKNEWDEFMSVIKENLPVAFRITGYKSEAQTLLSIVKGQFFKDVLNPGQKKNVNEQEKESEDLKLQPICLSWYPDNLAWQLELTRKDIRRSELYFRLHNFLISETNSGNISRQEAVSMIPPILLDVKSHHKVLDMCAAPGSKTAQIIELLHADEERLPTGFVIANDVDNQRCYMLVHQAKRLSSPCVVITNHDASVMPNFVSKKDGKEKLLKFDRVLCDVPCSGDGTLRKNPDIWMKWNAANGNNLHGIQYRILRRGSELLAVGGRLVYSTCSLNPLENEAVIHRMLKDAQGSLQLVDGSSLVPGLKYSPGMNYWLPCSKDTVSYTDFDQVPEKWRILVRPQMFPPSKEDIDKFKLDRCIRILPHHQDTGGFFVAILEKTHPLPWEACAKNCDKNVPVNSEIDSQEQPSVPLQNQPILKEPARKKRKIYGYREDPFIFFKEDEKVWPDIRDFYKIEGMNVKCLLTRCNIGKKKNIYFTSPAVRDIVQNNESKIKLINTGIKAFVHCSLKGMDCNFRLAQEGIHTIFPYIGENRKVKVPRSDLIKLLSWVETQDLPELSSLDSTTQQQLDKMDCGSCIIVYEDENGIPPLRLEMVGYKGMKCMRAYVATNDCIHYLRLIGEDVSKYDVNKFKKLDDGNKDIEVEEKDLIQETNICSPSKNKSVYVEMGQMMAGSPEIQSAR